MCAPQGRYLCPDGIARPEAALTTPYYPTEGLIPPHWHHQMLRDERRCAAFRQAIERVVQPGDVVFDAGAGTGLLSFFASAQARAVYAVEAHPAVAALGRYLIELNRLADKIDYRHGRAEQNLPSEPVAVVLCEMLHVGLAVEQQIPVLNAVRRGLEARFPGTTYRVVPESAVSYCQLVEADFTVHGFRAPFARLGDTYHADASLRPLSPLAPYHQAEFSAIVPPEIRASVRVAADQAGTVNALRLLTQAVLAYDPTGREPLIDWYLNYAVLPLADPLAAEPGIPFDIDLSYDAGCDLDAISCRVAPASRP